LIANLFSQSVFRCLVCRLIPTNSYMAGYPYQFYLVSRVIRRFSFLLACALTFFMCSFQYSFSSKIKPNILCCLIISSMRSPIHIFKLGHDWTLSLLLCTSSIFVFSADIVNPLSFAHVTILFVDRCSSFSAILGVRRLVFSTQSSEYPKILVGSSIFSHMLAIATKKSITFITALCGTPFSMFLCELIVLPIATLRVRSFIKFFVKPSNRPPIFHVLRVFNMPCLQQVS
jgi:hypothetical protein